MLTRSILIISSPDSGLVIDHNYLEQSMKLLSDSGWGGEGFKFHKDLEIKTWSPPKSTSK